MRAASKSLQTSVTRLAVSQATRTITRTITNLIASRSIPSIAPAVTPLIQLSSTVTSTRSFSTSAPIGTTLILADHDQTKLLDTTYNLITAAKRLGAKDIQLLILGSSQASAAAAEGSKIDGVTKVILVENEQFAHALAEGQSTTIADVAKETKATHILASTSASGKNILPRVGAHLDVQPITEVIEIQSADTFVRPIYAGNAISTVQSTDPVKIITVRPTSFEKAAAGSNSAPVEKKTSASAAASAGLSTWVSEELTRSARPSLSSARIVISGGRGLKSKENFAIIEELADACGGAVGASRAAVDAGYVPNDYQVGQTGKVVAPDLYVAVGISGAIQHLAGMKDSKVIVAINKDKEAPIFQVADYGLEGDLFKIVPEMTKLVKAGKK